jgi:hypothetical protein
LPAQADLPYTSLAGPDVFSDWRPSHYAGLGYLLRVLFGENTKTEKPGRVVELPDAAVEVWRELALRQATLAAMSCPSRRAADATISSV